MEPTDPSVTAQETRDALRDPGTDYAAVVNHQEDRNGNQDDVPDGPAALGLVSVVPATPRDAILNARKLRDDHTFVGVGYCLRVVHNLFRLPALWPDANTAMEHGAPIHRVSDLGEIPRGAVIGYHNSHYGHVSLGLGGGLTSTTDYHELGYEGVATIDNTARWCGATEVVWYEVLNGFDVWPDPHKPKPAPVVPWSLHERRDFLYRALLHARRDGHDTRAARLKQWIARIDRRLDAKH